MESQYRQQVPWAILLLFLGFFVFVEGWLGVDLGRRPAFEAPRPHTTDDTWASMPNSSPLSSTPTPEIQRAFPRVRPMWWAVAFGGLLASAGIVAAVRVWRSEDDGAAEAGR